jgi:hypothetical protein
MNECVRTGGSDTAPVHSGEEVGMHLAVNMAELCRDPRSGLSGSQSRARGSTITISDTVTRSSSRTISNSRQKGRR